jgi:nitrous oxide reductase accessory protein NosL
MDKFGYVIAGTVFQDAALNAMRYRSCQREEFDTKADPHEITELEVMQNGGGITKETPGPSGTIAPMPRWWSLNGQRAQPVHAVIN